MLTTCKANAANVEALCDLLYMNHLNADPLKEPQDMIIWQEKLVRFKGSGAVFRAFTDLFDGCIDETGNWIFRQSRFDSLRSTD